MTCRSEHLSGSLQASLTINLSRLHRQIYCLFSFSGDCLWTGWFYTFVYYSQHLHSFFISCILLSSQYSLDNLLSNMTKGRTQSQSGAFFSPDWLDCQYKLFLTSVWNWFYLVITWVSTGLKHLLYKWKFTCVPTLCTYLKRL